PFHLAQHFSTLPVSIINAGDGRNEHPSQALLDLLTIYQHKKNFADLCIVIVGDILHSRVTRSNLLLWQTLGVKNIRVVAPAALLPENIKQYNNVTVFSRLEEALKGADVIMALRLQKERMQQALIPHAEEYFHHYGLNEEKIRLAKPD